nr:ATP-binding protein [Acidimicrobium ferrooxidans]
MISARYETGSIICTSNKGFGEWGSLVGDPVLATAILDRLLHHATVLNIRGESYRLKDRTKQRLPGGLLSQAAEAMAKGGDAEHHDLGSYPL